MLQITEPPQLGSVCCFYCEALCDVGSRCRLYACTSFVQLGIIKAGQTFCLSVLCVFLPPPSPPPQHGVNKADPYTHMQPLEHSSSVFYRNGGILIRRIWKSTVSLLLGQWNQKQWPMRPSMPDACDGNNGRVKCSGSSRKPQKPFCHCTGNTLNH